MTTTLFLSLLLLKSFTIWVVEHNLIWWFATNRWPVRVFALNVWQSFLDLREALNFSWVHIFTNGKKNTCRYGNHHGFSLEPSVLRICCRLTILQKRPSLRGNPNDLSISTAYIYCLLSLQSEFLSGTQQPCTIKCLLMGDPQWAHLVAPFSLRLLWGRSLSWNHVQPWRFLPSMTNTIFLPTILLSSKLVIYFVKLLQPKINCETSTCLLPYSFTQKSEIVLQVKLLTFFYKTWTYFQQKKNDT